MTAGAPAEAPGPALHQPRRALTAAAEVLGAVLLLVAASWTWDRGIRHYSYDAGPDLPQLESTRYFGNWIGAAIVLGVLAGLLVLDAVRQVVLAVRTSGEDGFDPADGHPDHDHADLDHADLDHADLDHADPGHGHPDHTNPGRDRPDHDDEGHPFPTDRDHHLRA
ncbi:hypothetical protein APASM_6666 [Actinosynnema pretiosum subsp. pretiosum]|nr:hypothetical protein APASM_6666 [Actinosynnema pretiosum subsp. pretiosum]